MPVPLFSIIIPTYNSDKTLIRCLESILIQNLIDYEVWIIDGSSIDCTLNIINGYTERYSFFHSISETDNGIYDAMNKGIELSSGTWLYFLGSDDTLFNDNVLTLISKKIFGCTDKIIYGNVLMKGDNPWNLDGKIFAGEYSLERMLTMTICHQAIFFNKIVFEKYGNYNLKYNVNADYDLILRCSANTSFSYMNIIIANFYFGGYSTTSKEDDFKKDRVSLYLKYFKNNIFSKHFLGTRLYLREAAFSKNSSLNVLQRIICLLAYTKLKIHSVTLRLLKW